MFERIEGGDCGGTWLCGYVTLSPAGLIRAFGPPDVGDGYKSSGEYIFHGPDGETITLYDYKVTTLYMGEYDSEAPTPEEFWEREEHSFHIGGGGKTDLNKFKSWVSERVMNAPLKSVGKSEWTQVRVVADCKIEMSFATKESTATQKGRDTIFKRVRDEIHAGEFVSDEVQVSGFTIKEG